MARTAAPVASSQPSRDMNQTFSIGPLVLPALLLVAVLAWLAAEFAGRRLAATHAASFERHLYGLLLAGLLAARLAFVLQFGEVYLAAPLSALDVRDGGWQPLFGLAAAALYAVVLVLRRAELRKALAAALGAGAIVWTAGVLVLAGTAREDDRLPALALPALDGSTVSLAAFQGRPVVVNLWATWCPPCRREMPVLQQAQAEHANVHFVFLNQGESAARVQAYLATQALPLRNVLLDAQGAMGVQRGHRALPTTLFFDAQGRFVSARVGELSRASLADRISQLSAVPQP